MDGRAPGRLPRAGPRRGFSRTLDRPSAGLNTQVVGRHIGDVGTRDFLWPACPSKPSPARTAVSRLMRQSVAGETMEDAVQIGDVDGADLRVQIVGEKGEHSFSPSVCRRCSPLDASAELRLTGSQPGPGICRAR